jgi:hypothetical protein
MQVNDREEHNTKEIDGLFCRSPSSCCEARGGSTRVPNPREDMKRRAIALDDIDVLFLCDAWGLGKDYREPNLMSLEVDVIPCLEEDLFLYSGCSMEVLVLVLMQELKT